MEQKFKMQIQRLAKHAAAVLTAVTVGILSAAAVFTPRCWAGAAAPASPAWTPPLKTPIRFFQI